MLVIFIPKICAKTCAEQMLSGSVS